MKLHTFSLTKKGKTDLKAFETLFEIADDDDKDGKKLFKLLDFDDNEKIEFPELMLYIFCTVENLSGEQKRGGTLDTYMYLFICKS